MFKKILQKLHLITEADHKKIVEGLIGEMAAMQSEHMALRAKVATMVEPEEVKEKTVIDVSLGDPIPQDTDTRKMYVATVAGFFKEILEPKLKYMISNVHNMFEEVGNDRDFDLILKGVTYSFREMIKWGESMVNEQVANQNPDAPDDDKTVEERLQEFSSRNN